jgi:arabinofuranosyltransferase
MRYAWNFSHGHGLVWNQGEYVQGYTNLLMVLIMSFLTFILSKTMAVLAVQVLGVFLVLLTAFFNMKMAAIVFPAETGREHALFGMLSFVCGILYYPLVYWSLMGMETGLLSALLLAGIFFAFQYVRSLDFKHLFLVALLGGLAFLARNDSMIYFAVLWTYICVTGISNDNHRAAFLRHLTVIGVYFVIILGQLGFQYLYYGESLPNTYVLKLTGMPLLDRVQNGLGFILPYIRETAIVFLLAVTGLLIRVRRETMVLFFLVLISVLYQIYVGGDPWSYWRIMAPTMPLLLLLCVDAAFNFGRKFSFPKMTSPDLFRNSLALILIILGVLSINLRFLSEISFQIRPYQVNRNARNVNTAIVLNDILKDDATVGVFWAGTIPYYIDNVAIDFLGKSDRHIANLPPDLSGSVAFNGMTSVPGHNKYDLNYSIVTLKPTYIPKLFYGRQDVSPIVGDEYVNVRYRYITLFLLKNSPDVNWKKLDLQ